MQTTIKFSNAPAYKGKNILPKINNLFRMTDFCPLPLWRASTHSKSIQSIASVLKGKFKKKMWYFQPTLKVQTKRRYINGKSKCQHFIWRDFEEKKQFQLATSIESKRDNIINCLLLKVFKYFKQWSQLSTVRKIIPKKDFKSIYITKRHTQKWKRIEN